MSPASLTSESLTLAGKPSAAVRAKRKPKRKPKKTPTCTARDIRDRQRRQKLLKQGKVKRAKKIKLRKCKLPAKVVPQPASTAPRTDGLRTYTGPFGPAEATRLLFRAGFGPKPGQADAVASLGVTRAVDALVNASAGVLEGPEPTGTWLVGGQFAPLDHWGHGHLQWLDRMVRSSDQLTERVALVLHDWIPVSWDEAERKELNNFFDLFRTGWKGSFRDLMKKISVHPCMLMYLNGLHSTKGSPNENFAREIMELFCLGADRGAYTEADIRELARAFTGWTCSWSEAENGNYNYRFEPTLWDAGTKVVFAGLPWERRGALDTPGAVDAIIDHPMHPRWVAEKLWNAFIPTPPTELTLNELAQLYRSSGERLQPVVRAILLHPDLYTGQAMVKSPVTYSAALLRARNTGIQHVDWSYFCSSAGQMMWAPPNVAGWNEEMWLNTVRYRARHDLAGILTRDNTRGSAAYAGITETTQQAVEAALAFWGRPVISDTHYRNLMECGDEIAALPSWSVGSQQAYRYNALLALVPVGPDFQVS